MFNNDMFKHLYSALLVCSRERSVPQDKKDANVIMLYINKREHSDCSNYRGLCFLSVNVEDIHMGHFQEIATSCNSENHFKFHVGRSTIDLVFASHSEQLEKCLEQRSSQHSIHSSCNCI